MNTTGSQSHALLFFLAATGILVSFIFLPFLTPLALAAIFAVVLYPVYARLLKWSGNHEALSALAAVLVGLICLVLPLALIGARLLVEAQGLYVSFAYGGGHALFTLGISSINELIVRLVPGTTGLPGTFATDLSTYV